MLVFLREKFIDFTVSLIMQEILCSHFELLFFPKIDLKPNGMTSSLYMCPVNLKTVAFWKIKYFLNHPSLYVSPADLQQSLPAHMHSSNGWIMDEITHCGVPDGDNSGWCLPNMCFQMVTSSLLWKLMGQGNNAEEQLEGRCHPYTRTCLNKDLNCLIIR